MLKYIKNYNCASALYNALFAALCGGMEIQMKKIVSLLLSAVLVFGFVFSFTSCTEAPADAGAEISVYLGADVYDFDPTDYYVDSNAEQVMSLLYEPLFKINADGERQYAMAIAHEVDIINREIKIELRESYWSDGTTRVVPSDFVYAWRNVLLAPSNANPASVLLFDIENAVAVKSGDKEIDALGVVDDDENNTLTITYREGADYERLLDNLAALATAPVRYSAVSMGKDYWSKDVSTIMTNGPYKIETLEYYIVGGEFTLERNLGYHQKNDAVEYTQHVTPNKLLSLLTMGEELTFSDKSGKMKVSIEDLDKTVFYMGDASLEYRKVNKDKAIVADDLSVYSYVFNTNKAPFNNKDVRRALSLAIDRNAIIEEIVFGKAANGFLPEAVAKSVYGDNVASRLSADMEEAQALIDAAELSAEDMEFTLTINKDEESRKIAEIAVEAWEELGFTVTVKEVGYIETEIIDTSIEGERSILDSAIQNLVKDASYGVYNYDVIAVDWQLYSKDALVSLASFTEAMNGNGATLLNNTSRKNIAAWSDNKYNSYLNAAFNARSEEARMNALAEAEKILLEEAPIVPVIFNQSFAFVSSELSEVSFDGFGNIVLTKAILNNYHAYLPKEE